MARKKNPPIDADERDAIDSPDMVRERLNQFVRSTFKSWHAFHQATGISRATATAWKPGGDALPNLENLLKFAEQGLSLDWLATGRGTMKRRIGSLEIGAFLESMLPFLQRSAGVGQQSASQAFAKLGVRFGPEQLLEKAANGLQSDFDAAVAEGLQLDQHWHLVRWFDDQLASLERAAKAGRLEIDDEVLAGWRKRLLEDLPRSFRPGTSLWREYWEAVDSTRREFIAAAASRASPASPGRR